MSGQGEDLHQLQLLYTMSSGIGGESYVRAGRGFASTAIALYNVGLKSIQLHYGALYLAPTHLRKRRAL